MRVNQRSVRTRCVGFRHEGESSLEQSIKSMTILQVLSRKVAGLENALRLDVVGFQDVTQESRDQARSFASSIAASASVTRALPSVPRVSSHLNCMPRSRKRRKM